MEVLSSSDELRVRTQGAHSAGANAFANDIAKSMLIRMMAEGRTIKECSTVLKRHPYTLQKWAGEPGFREKLREINEQAFQRLDAELKRKAEHTFAKIQEVSDDALNKLLDLMEHADSQVVQMRCAQDLLDRNPETSKTHKVEKTTRSVSISAEFLRLVETSEREAGTTIDG